MAMFDIDLESYVVPATEVVSYRFTLKLVRSLSEHQIRRDPTCKFKHTKEIPKVTEHMRRRFVPAARATYAPPRPIPLTLGSEESDRKFQQEATVEVLPAPKGLKWIDGEPAPDSGWRSIGKFPSIDI